MDVPLISHVVGAGRSVTFDSASRSRLSSRVDPCLFKVSDLQRRSGAVLQAGRASTVLIQDQDITYALEPWANWQFEHGLLAAMGQIAGLGDGPEVQLAAEPLLANIAEAVLNGTLAPFAGAEIGVGAHPEQELHVFSAAELQVRYRDVLKIAASGQPVVISRWNRPVGVLEPFLLRNREAEFVRHLDDTVRFLTAAHVAAERRVPLQSWVTVTAYPWLSVLPEEAIGEFSEEILPALLDAMRENDPDVFATMLTAWQSSCEARADEDFVEAMKVPAASLLGTRVRVEAPADIDAGT